VTTRSKSAPFARFLLPLILLILPTSLLAQGVTTSAMNGFVLDQEGAPVANANVTATHLPTGTLYRAVARQSGAFTIPNMRVGGPYRVAVTFVGFKSKTEDDVFLNLGQNRRLDFELERQVVQLEEVVIAGQQDPILNADRTGAATFITPEQVMILPSIKRSTRDLTRIDPRSDGNFSFAGRNWLYNNVSLDGSYFNNPYGLDDPAPGGQSNAEPVPYDAVEQVQVSVAPFDVREGGFTGANVNTVTRSGTNQFHAALYGFGRNENLLGNTVSGQDVIANPNLSFVQAGASVSGALIRDKLFFYATGEIERTDDPGTNFVADRDGNLTFGESRVTADTMEAIRNRMIQVYNYDPGEFDGYIYETDNNKLLVKLDWNVNENHNATLRWNYLDAKRDQGPHPFVFSFANTGRGPNESTLPFQNTGYAINNNLNSFAFELNSRTSRFANRFFASFNRFRDHRDPFSEDFPTIEIGENGVAFTTIGHEPFSIQNVLDQDVWQLTNNFNMFRGNHVFTLGANYERFSFFNSFNLFRHGFPNTFPTLAAFFAATDPAGPVDFRSQIGTGPFKGEDISVGQLGLYAQDEVALTPRFNLTAGLRVDIPMYYTDPVDNPFSRGLTALDETRNPETVDQSKLPGAKALFSPRLGFNWNAVGNRRTQVRGGTGIFTGRVPFVWLGNAISNPGFNPNLPGNGNSTPDTVFIRDNTILQQSFDLNAIDPDFSWPQVWTSDIAVDQQLPWDMLGTLELIYSKDINAVFMRNADLVAPVSTLPAPDGRPFFGGAGNNELNPDGAGIYVLDNTDEGYAFNISTLLRKRFGGGAEAFLSYAFTQAKNNLKSTEIASVLWSSQPIQGDPNNPEMSYSEFGQRHRIIGGATFAKNWSSNLRTSIGLFLEISEGNRFAGAGGNRYSFIYSGDVNGDGQGGNDLIYIPASQSEIIFVPDTLASGPIVSPQEQWNQLDAFIGQDKYLNSHRGQIAERFGAVNPWYSNLDLRILQDIGLVHHRFQLSLDVQNVLNFIDSDWGVRKVASVAATSPLTLYDFDVTGAPRFKYTGPGSAANPTQGTFIDDPTLLSRWRAQLGLRYFFE
jgi:Carboxypeptidase regulatory-like domain/TonB dependent receptor